MEATQDHERHEHHRGGHGHAGSGSEQQDWQSQEFVDDWIQRQASREPERRRQFVTMRALIPMAADQDFSYVNLGAGSGNLDDVLLAHFTKARATLVDTSQAMLDSAKERLTPYLDRIEFRVADLSDPDWTQPFTAPFDIAVSSFAAHHAGAAERVRDLYAETYSLLVPGGVFVNLEYVRWPRPDLVALAGWAGKDHEAGLNANSPRHSLPGTTTEQIAWLLEAGFAAADAMWKNLTVVAFCAIKGQLHLPETGPA